jgi:hypothetical protein
VCCVFPADGLYVPEGWWHAVQSACGTVAVNFWYQGRRHDMIDAKLTHYLLRVSMEAAVLEWCKEGRQAHVRGSCGRAALPDRMCCDATHCRHRCPTLADITATVDCLVAYLAARGTCSS